MFKSTNNEQKIQQYIDRLIHDHPDNHIGAYLNANRYWKKKDKNKALFWPNEAKKRDPQNKDVEYTLNMIQNNKQQNAFRIKFGIPIQKIFFDD